MRLAVYAESSAVLTWLLGEEGAPEVADVLENAERVLVSSLTLLEAERGLVQQVAAGKRTEAEGSRLRGALAREAARWSVAAIDDDVLERAGRPFPREPVRALDAIHLATALEIVAAVPHLTVLTRDRRIDENARLLGLPVV